LIAQAAGAPALAAFFCLENRLPGCQAVLSQHSCAQVAYPEFG
jgi:hypothetical protein